MSAAGKKAKAKTRTQGVVREYFELIAETAVFVFFVMTFVVQAFQIPSGSMEPTLLVGDFLLVNKLVYASAPTGLERALLPRRAIRRQDIVVFKFPRDLSKDFVKRVIGLPGETLEIRGRQVLIDGKPLDEPYKVHIDSGPAAKDDVYRYESSIRDSYGPLKIPAGQLFVMGDNRDNSDDSRFWGLLPMANIKGRPWVIYFSYRAESAAARKPGLGERLKRIVSFLPRARWGRLFKLVR